MPPINRRPTETHDNPSGSANQGAGKPNAKEKDHDYSRVFAAFGVMFGNRTGSEAWAEECPFCGRDRFSVNVLNGQYECKKCQAKGNAVTYLTWVHRQYLDATTNEHYLALKVRRGIAWQTLKLHQLAFDAENDRWLIPFKNPQGNVCNVQFYYPDRTRDNKRNLPELPTAIYGFDRLAKASNDLPVLVCEGPFDAMAADYSIGAANRPKYVIVATPGTFKEEWAIHFKGRKVRLLYDNDKGGRQHSERAQKFLGESGIASEVLVLRWPEGTPDGYDVNDFVRDNPKSSIVGFVRDNCFKVVAQPRLAWVHASELKSEEEVIDWVWPDRMRCGSYVSFSGYRGTLKSTLMREVAAKYTQGELMPECEELGLLAGHVIYITAEDSIETAIKGLKLAGADMDRVILLPAVLKDGDMMNVLEHLEEIRQKVREYGVRLVIIDGQNSVVGAPCIATDILGRHNVTNKLHQFAQKENICLVGIRNEDMDGRAYGPASMNDLSRCIIRSVQVGSVGHDRYFELRFERISDSAPETHPPIPYSVENLGGSSRRILWGKLMPEPPKPAKRKGGKATGAEADTEADTDTNTETAASIIETLGHIAIGDLIRAERSGNGTHQARRPRRR
jgi:hypothetical protein